MVRLMQLIAFTVENYRSITQAHKLSLASSAVLVGPNNEGKSNILRALVAAISILTDRNVILRLRLRTGIPLSSLTSSYVWKKDHPVALQNKPKASESVLNLEFQLTDSEIEQF